MDPQIVQWIVQGCIGIIASVAVKQLSHIAQSIEELNRNVAILLERTASHERILTRHESELDFLRREK